MEHIQNVIGMLKKVGIKKVITNTLWFIVGAVLSPAEFILGSLPFGFALVSAVSTQAVSVISGVIVGALITGKIVIPYIISMVICIALRLFSSKGSLNEPIPKRVIISFAASIIFCAVNSVFSGFEIKEISSAIATVAFSGLFAFLYSVKFSPDKVSVSVYDSGNAAIAFTLLYVFNDVDIYGFIPSVAAAYLITIFTSKSYGFMKGGIIGLVTGLACGADAVILAPLLGICGLLCGILSEFSDTVAISSVLFASMVYTIYASDVAGVESTFQNVILVIIIFVPLNLIYKKLGKSVGVGKNKIKIYDYAMPTFASTGTANERIIDLSKAYGELSEAFNGMGRHQTSLNIDELGGIIKNAMSTTCSECSNKSKCRQRRAFLEQTVKLVRRYTQKSKAIPITKSSLFPADCKGSELISRINSEYKKQSFEKAQKDRCMETAENMAEMSKILKSIGDCNTDTVPNPAIAEKISDVLAEMRIRSSGVYAQGTHGVSAYAYDVIPSDISVGAKQLAKALSDACEVDFATPKLTRNNKGYTLVIERAQKLYADISNAQLSISNENICGDSILSFETPSSYFSVICDGMGSGADAAATSRMACIMFEKLVTSGCGVGVTIEMINRLLINKFDEVFTTLDILQIDKFTGESSIYKAGAAPSVIIRNGKKYELNSCSTPAGIVDEIAAENIKLRLCPEDMLIMLSDGALDALGGTDKVHEKVVAMMPSNASEICRALKECCIKSDCRRDDISVSIIRIRAYK